MHCGETSHLLAGFKGSANSSVSSESVSNRDRGIRSVEAKITYLPLNKKVEVGIKHFALSSEFYLLELF